jgi:hypothetical protein
MSRAAGYGRIGWRGWTGLALPPVAWAVHHQFGSDLNYADCAASRAPALLVGLLCLAVLGLGAGLSWREWRRAGGAPDAKQEPVGRFLCALGLMLAVLLGLTLLMQMAALLILPACFG